MILEKTTIVTETTTEVFLSIWAAERHNQSKYCHETLQVCTYHQSKRMGVV